MENPKKEDIKKPEEKTPEVSKETPEEVEEEKVEKAEGYMGQIDSNAKNIDGNLKSVESPEAEEIRSENKNVADEAGKEFGGFKNAINKEKKPEIEKAINPNEQIKTINYWLTEAEKCTDMATAKSFLEVVEEELAKARNANIDTSQIANLEERIEKIKEKINSEKMEHAKPVDMAKEETKTVPLETEKIIPEPKFEPEPSPKTETPETEKTAKDIENEKLADEIEEEMNKEKFDIETKERLNEWNEKSEDEKKEEIKGEKSRIEGALGNRTMAENANLIEQKNIEEILANRDELAALRKKLDEEVKESMEKNREISDKIKGGIDPNADLSQLNINEQAMAKEAVDGFLKTTKDVLSVKEIDYLLEEMNNPENLLKNHGERKIEIEELREIIKAIEEYKEFMEKFEKMTKEQQEEAREELGRFVEQLNQIEKKNKNLFKIIAALGIIGGVAILVSTIGLPAGMSVPTYLTAKNILIGSALVAGGAVAIYKRKAIGRYIGKGAGAAIGAGVVLDAMFDGKKWDGWMEKICGVRVPWGAESKKEK